MVNRNRGKYYTPMSLDELVQYCLDNRVEQVGNCLLYTRSLSGNGYAQVIWKGKAFRLHRLVCEWKHGPTLLAGKDAYAIHRCGNRRCINPDHLAWADAKINGEDERWHRLQDQLNAMFPHRVRKGSN